ncbi:hypothetical protein INT45_003721 [Circinella minor]|uniref:Uncharacterized protein n=1 Tax=Circinella minor TaxID=1195481 RepID=A0A8H7SAH0_9FUNG|nr:hypothetical protein INT45_003721 [Circinella minor]
MSIHQVSVLLNSETHQLAVRNKIPPINRAFVDQSMEIFSTLLSEFSMEELYQELSRRMQTEQEQRSHDGVPIW